MATLSTLPGALNLEVYRGDDFFLSLAFELDDEDETPIDISAWTLTAQVRLSRHDLPTVAPVALWVVTISNGPAGYAQIALTDTQTAALTRSVYAWDLQRSDGDIHTLLSGHLIVKGDVTRG